MPRAPGKIFETRQRRLVELPAHVLGHCASRGFPCRFNDNAVSQEWLEAQLGLGTSFIATMHHCLGQSWTDLEIFNAPHPPLPQR